MKISELLEGDVVGFPKRNRRNPLNMTHHSLFGSDLPAEPAARVYRNGVSVERIPQGWRLLINGQPHDDSQIFDDPERAHEEATELELTLDHGQ